MSTRCPAQVKRTVLTAAESRSALGLPAAGLALVSAADEGERSAQQDAQVESRRAVLHVPDVELDALLPRQRGPAVDLRPARQPGPDLEPPALPLGVLLDLVAERRPGADHAHLAA